MTDGTLNGVSKNFAGSYIGTAADGREMFGVKLKDGRDVRIYVSKNGKVLKVFIDGAELKKEKK